MIKYHAPIKTKKGHATYFKVDLCEGLGVNSIMGMSMIWPCIFILDTENDVFISDVLNLEPFPVTYNSVQRTMPGFNNNDRNSTVLFTTNNNNGMKDMVKSCIEDAFTVSNKPVADRDNDYQNPILVATK